MANNRKENRRYVFTVEGETEQWYFDWLEEQINACNDSRYTVSIVAKVQQSPKKYSKTVNPISTPKVTIFAIMKATKKYTLQSSKTYCLS